MDPKDSQNDFNIQHSRQKFEDIVNLNYQNFNAKKLEHAFGKIPFWSLQTITLSLLLLFKW